MINPRLLTICLLGVALAGLADSATPPKPKFSDFMGINGHTIQFKPKLYRPVASLVRDYHPVEWDLGKDSSSVPPFPFAANRVDWKEVYGSWKQEGWRTDVSLMFETIPQEKWKNLGDDSRAYAVHFAKSFGPGSAMPIVESVEIGNEPGKFSDENYRIIFQNMSAAFKKADPGLKIATCNLTTGKSHDYAKSVDCVKGLENSYDILNIHSYAELEGWPTWKRSYPEDPKLKHYLTDIQKLAEWRDKNAPGKEIWLTEFGYDASTKKPDQKTEFKNWTGVTEEQQAQWTVRSWFLFATLPISRAYVYFFNDSDQPQVHGASGLTRNYQPKPVFHAAAHLQRTLSDYQFSDVIQDRPGESMIYEFRNTANSKQIIWALWSPTGNGRSMKLKLPILPGNVIKAEKMPLEPGASKNLNLSSNVSEVEIDESPLYLFISIP